MPDIIVEKTQDMELIKSLMLRPEIWIRFAGDDREAKRNFQPQENKYCKWFIFKENSVVVGFLVLLIKNQIDADIHFYSLKEHKMKARNMMRVFFKFICETSLLKINICIPNLYRSTINFAKKMGFVPEGIRRQSYMLDGIIYDKTCLGITSQEIKKMVIDRD